MAETQTGVHPDLDLTPEVQRVLELGMGIPLYGQIDKTLDGYLKEDVGVVGTVLFSPQPRRAVAVLNSGDMFTVQLNDRPWAGVYTVITPQTYNLRFSIDRGPTLKEAFLRGLNWGQVIADNSVPDQAAEIIRTVREAIQAKQKSVQDFRDLVGNL